MFFIQTHDLLYDNNDDNTFYCSLFATLWQCHRLRIVRQTTSLNTHRANEPLAHIDLWMDSQSVCDSKRRDANVYLSFSFLCQSTEERWNLGNKRKWMMCLYYHIIIIIIIYPYMPYSHPMNIYFLAIALHPVAQDHCRAICKNLFFTCHLRCSQLCWRKSLCTISARWCAECARCNAYYIQTIFSDYITLSVSVYCMVCVMCMRLNRFIAKCAF